MPFPYEFNQPQNQEPTPAQIVNEAALAAEQGQMPILTSEALLASLHLDGEEPDQKTLMERFTGDEMNFRTMREIPRLMANAKKLVLQTNERTANEAQETLAHAIGDVITTQINREGDICPGARDIAMSSTREDIVPAHVKAKIEQSEQETLEDIEAEEADFAQFAAQMEMLEAMLPQILGQVIMGGQLGRFGDLTENGPIIIPIIVDSSPFAMSGDEGNTPVMPETPDNHFQRVTEAQAVPAEEGSVCLRALKNMCK